jgi:hypothetical protein
VRKAFTILCFAAATAAASTITFNTLPGNTEYGTYNGYIMSTVDGQANQPLICDDFDHTTYVPSGKMTFYLSTLIGSTPLEYARFVNGDTSAALFQYREAAFLLDGLNQTGPGQVTDLTAAYQYALWHLFTPSVVLPTPTAQTLLNTAAASVRTGGLAADLLYSRLLIYTPTSAYASNQEFLQLSSAPDSKPWAGDKINTPEPSTAWLFGLGGGMLVLAHLARRLERRRLKRAVVPVRHDG